MFLLLPLFGFSQEESNKPRSPEAEEYGLLSLGST